jgi:LuxR family maltose regulon positive regulatory protein
MPSNLIIARTKVLIPQRRPELLTRERLLEMLNDLLDYKLIIVAAPAGYGKTSLLIDFVQKYPWPVCWLALDQMDQDAQRFIAYFIASIHQRFESFGKSSQTALQNMSPEDLNLDFLVSAITNDIIENISEHFIIVLDDYHILKESPIIDKFLSDFLQKADENCHLVITSRKLLTLPDLPLLVARSQVGGLSVEELAFIPEEIQELYSQNLKQQISLKEASSLAQQSEGWITGLLLTSQMMKQGMGDRLQIARASGIGLYEYLSEQVLEQQPKPLQQFLLRSSLLEEFDSDICTRVIGKALGIQENWELQMESALHNNVFVLLIGEDRLWLRYHHLFQDFLQERIRREKPIEAEKIQLELASYYADQQDWDHVFNIYRKLGKKRELSELLEKIGSDFIAKGRVNKLAEWLKVLPEEIIDQKAPLASLQASVAVNKGKTQDGLVLFNKVIAALQKTGKNMQLADNLVRRSSTRRLLGDYEGSLLDADQALELCNGKEKMRLLRAEALRAKGSTFFQQGRLKDALSWLKESLNIYQDNNQEQDIARVLVEIGAVSVSLGEFTAAEQAYKKSLRYWQSIGDSIWQANLLNNLGVLQHSIGDFENSFLNLEKAMQYANLNGNLRMEGYSLASIGDLYRDLEAYREAQDAYQKALDIAQQIEDQFLIFYLKLAQGRVQIDQGNIHKAELLIRSAHLLAKQTGSLYEVNRYRLENSLLDFASHRYSSAVENLSTAIQYFKDEGHLDDYARAELLLGVASYMNGDLEKSREVLELMMAHLHQPQGRVTLLASSGEVEANLNEMLGKGELGELIEVFTNEVEPFKNRILISRRQIRKQATVVTFAPPKMILRAFGKVEVTANNHTLTSADWRSQNARNLLFLFLSCPDGLTKEEVGLYFWPDLSSAELKLRFKNAIYRLRHAAGTDVIIFHDNNYLFNRALDFEYDVHVFVNNLDHADHEKNAEKKKSFLQIAIGSYSGPYLSDVDEDWAALDRQRYVDLYLKALKDLATLFFEQKQYSRSLEIIQRAIHSDSCFEDGYRLSMRVQHAMGNLAEVARTYKQCQDILLAEIGTEPSSQTQQLFAKLKSS